MAIKKKQITARMYIGGNPVSKAIYETGADSTYGKKIARLVLDEFIGFVRLTARDDGASWIITFTDGESEIAFSSTDKEFDISVEVDGEQTDTIGYHTIGTTEAMWNWMETRGWY